MMVSAWYLHAAKEGAGEKQQGWRVGASTRTKQPPRWRCGKGARGHHGV
jgi:hypothetical protein